MTTVSNRHPNVTVSIVSHNQQALILPLMEQLEKFCSTVVAKIVLTINVPETEFVTTREWKIPLEIIRNTRIKGFGANHNAAFQNCNTEWFLVLNPDIRLQDDLLTPLITVAEPQAGILAPRIMEPGKTSPEAHRALLTPLEILRRKKPNYLPPTTPAWLPGLFMMFRQTAYKQVEGFDQRFFMYGEDFDISAKTQLAGWKLQIAENLVVQHDARRASHKSHQHLYWHITSLLKVWMSAAFWRYRKLCRNVLTQQSLHRSGR